MREQADLVIVLLHAGFSVTCNRRAGRLRLRELRGASPGAGSTSADRAHPRNIPPRKLGIIIAPGKAEFVTRIDLKLEAGRCRCSWTNSNQAMEKQPIHPAVVAAVKLQDCPR